MAFPRKARELQTNAITSDLPRGFASAARLVQVRAMTSPDSADVIRLETKIAYQDKLLADLNDVVVDLNRSVTELSRRLVTVERLLSAELGRREMPNEKPPHY